MSANIFFIGDTHFGHSNIIEFMDTRKHFKTIEHHDEALVELWNTVVKPKDIVYHLGDVAFGRDNLKYVRQLHGTKHLIMGNHDTYPIVDYIEAGFVKILGAFKYKEFILTHVPVHTNQLEFRWEYNIHGHIHNPERYSLDYRYFNVNADVIGLTPMPLEQVRTRIQIVENHGKLGTSDTN